MKSVVKYELELENFPILSLLDIPFQFGCPLFIGLPGEFFGPDSAASRKRYGLLGGDGGGTNLDRKSVV